MIKNHAQKNQLVAEVSSDHLKRGRELAKLNLFISFNSMKCATFKSRFEALPDVVDFFQHGFSHQVHQVSTEYSKSF